MQHMTTDFLFVRDAFLKRGSVSLTYPQPEDLDEDEHAGPIQSFWPTTYVQPTIGNNHIFYGNRADGGGATDKLVYTWERDPVEFVEMSEEDHQALREILEKQRDV